MQLIGKVVKKELKDFAKGKDAEADEKLIVTAKLDGEDGMRGALHFAPGEHADDYELGDTITVEVEQRQTKLQLGKGARRAAAE